MEKVLEHAALGRQKFPQPTSAGLERLAALWPKQAEEIIDLLSVTVTGQGEGKCTDPVNAAGCGQN